MAFFYNFLLIAGALTVAAAALKLARFIRVYSLSSRIDRYAHQSLDGRPPWALVTGASDGIGRALADELAQRGFNVVLHGRNPTKLETVLVDLQERYRHRSFRMLVADASMVACMNVLKTTDGAVGGISSIGAIDFDAIKAELADLHLTVLVNNAGGGPSNPIYMPLEECNETRITGNVSLNALFPMHLMRVLLSILSKNSPAVVVNVSSLSDEGFPLLLSYSASKAFLMNLTHALRLEMSLLGKANEVECLGVRVGKVTEVSHSKADPTFLRPSARTMAQAVLARVGHGHGIVTGYWGHGLQQLMLDVIPGFVKDKAFIDAILRERSDELAAIANSKKSI